MQNFSCESHFPLTVEMAFLMARKVKTWMRPTMLPARLNSVAMLDFNKEMLDCFNVNAIANLFAKSKDKRKRMFGKFTEKNL